MRRMLKWDYEEDVEVGLRERREEKKIERRCC